MTTQPNPPLSGWVGDPARRTRWWQSPNGSWDLAASVSGSGPASWVVAAPGFGAEVSQREERRGVEPTVALAMARADEALAVPWTRRWKWGPCDLDRG